MPMALPSNSQEPIAFFGSMSVNSKIVSPSGVQIAAGLSSSPIGPLSETN